MGGGGVIFSIINYIKNQYSEDKFYGLLLILIVAIFTLIFCIYFIRPIIEWVFINKMHEREVNNKKNDKKHISDQFGKIINFKINRKLKQEELNDEKITKTINELKNIEEE